MFVIICCPIWFILDTSSNFLKEIESKSYNFLLQRKIWASIQSAIHFMKGFISYFTFNNITSKTSTEPQIWYYVSLHKNFWRFVTIRRTCLLLSQFYQKGCVAGNVIVPFLVYDLFIATYKVWYVKLQHNDYAKTFSYFASQNTNFVVYGSISYRNFKFLKTEIKCHQKKPRIFGYFLTPTTAPFVVTISIYWAYLIKGKYYKVFLR